MIGAGAAGLSAAKTLQEAGRHVRPDPFILFHLQFCLLSYLSSPSPCIPRRMIGKTAESQVLVLEARDRAGGRAWSEVLPGYSQPVELGADFIKVMVASCFCFWL